LSVRPCRLRHGPSGKQCPKEVARVELPGSDGPLAFSRDATGLVVALPPGEAE
jgi:hypothetical protein